MNKNSDIKVLVINCGSSSVKFQLINMFNENVLASGVVERLGLHQSLIKFKFKDKDFAMLAVSIDKDGKKSVEPFMNEYKLTFPAILDPEGITSKLYKTTGVPETFIIGKNGIVIHKVIGPRDWGTEPVFGVFEKIISNTSY